TVIDILDHLGGLDIGPNEGSIQFRVEGCQQVAAGAIQFPYDGLGRAIEILDRRTFAQKFRVVADTEVDSRLFPGAFLERRNNNLTHRARQNDAADDDGVAARLVPEALADHFANTPDIGQVKI